MSDETTTLEIKGLDQLLKALKKQPPIGRIGILGSKNNRTKKEGSGSAPTNATIGAAHEYGTSTHEQRSFLRVPLADNLDKEIENSGALDKDVMREVIKSGSVMPWLSKIMVLAEGIVAGAFDSNGYGKWAPWKTKGYENNTGQILVDTHQLRDSITSEIKET